MPSSKEIIGVNDIKDKNLWKYLLAEFFGTLMLNFIGCGSCVELTGEGGIVRIAFAFGLVIMAAVQGLGHISGGHFNPAVTIGFLVVLKISVIKSLLYMLVQCAGCLGGSAILRAVLPDDRGLRGSVGVTSVHSSLNAIKGLGIEIMLGFALVLVVFAVNDPNRENVGIIKPFAIGLTITMGHMMAVPLTGASMNPARSLGAAIVDNSWTDHWVYWAGPIAGGVVGAVLYHFVFKAEEGGGEEK